MDFQPLTRFIDRLTAWRIPWAEVIVMHRGEEVFRYRNGFADLEGKSPIEEGHIIQLYSMTKIMTCTAALKLVERGDILLGDPLSAYLPEYAEMTVLREDGGLEKATRPITVRDLFTMTAGFTYNLNSPSLRELAERTGGRMPTREFAAALAKEPLLFEPGTRFNYSLCHDVLGALIEVVDGRRFGDFLRDEIIGPLGMHDTGFDLPDDKRNRLAPQYEYNESLGRAVRRDGNNFRLGTEFESGGAGLYSTAADYVRFLDALTNRGTSRDGVRILSPSSVDLMRTDHLTTPALRDGFSWDHMAGYGYGLGVRTHVSRAASGSLSSLGEFGWQGAAGSLAVMDPEAELTIMYAQHMLNSQEPYVLPRLRNIVYSCLRK